MDDDEKSRSCRGGRFALSRQGLFTERILHAQAALAQLRRKSKYS